MLNKIVSRVAEPSAEAQSDAERETEGESDGADEAEERLYIPEELKYRAELRFDKKGNGVAGLVLTAVLTVALAILLIKLMPDILQLVDNFISMVSPSSNFVQ